MKNNIKIMCTVTLNINEALVRRVNPELTDMASINRWAQQQMDNLIEDLIDEDNFAKEHLKPLTMAEINAMLDEAEANFAAGRGIPDEEVFPDMDKEFYSPEEAYGLVMKDINAEERAYWAQSVERDLADIASGKPRKYVSGDEFWSRFEEAVETVFVDKILPSAMMTH